MIFSDSLQAERVHELNEEIGKLLAKVEQLGAEGNVEESQKVMDEVEKARAKKREAEVTKFFMVVYRALVSVLPKEHIFD